MKLTRAQEELLIQVGLQTLLERNGLGVLTTVAKPPAPKTKPRRKTKPTRQPAMRWSPEHRERFMHTIQRKKEAEAQAETPPPDPAK